MSNLNAFLDKQGLTHYDSKLKTVVAGQMTIEGRTLTLKSVSGATLATVTMPQTIYELATAQKDGLMSRKTSPSCKVSRLRLRRSKTLKRTGTSRSMMLRRPFMYTRA